MCGSMALCSQNDLAKGRTARSAQVYMDMDIQSVWFSTFDRWSSYWRKERFLSCHAFTSFREAP